MTGQDLAGNRAGDGGDAVGGESSVTSEQTWAGRCSGDVEQVHPSRVVRVQQGGGGGSPSGAEARRARGCALPGMRDGVGWMGRQATLICGRDLLRSD